MNKQIFTIIEAEVSEDKWDLLKEKYREVDKESLPKAVLSSHLVQDVQELEKWKIVTIWESIEAINEYRKNVETPAWILVFQAVNAEPKLATSNIVDSK